MPKQRTGEIFAPQNLPNSFLRTEYLVLATDCAVDMELVEKICVELQDLNGKLVKANAHYYLYQGNKSQSNLHRMEFFRQFAYVSL